MKEELPLQTIEKVLEFEEYMKKETSKQLEENKKKRKEAFINLKNKRFR